MATSAPKAASPHAKRSAFVAAGAHLGANPVLLMLIVHITVVYGPVAGAIVSSGFLVSGVSNTAFLAFARPRLTPRRTMQILIILSMISAGVLPLAITTGVVTSFMAVVAIGTFTGAQSSMNRAFVGNPTGDDTVARWLLVAAVMAAATGQLFGAAVSADATAAGGVAAATFWWWTGLFVASRLAYVGILRQLPNELPPVSRRMADLAIIFRIFPHVRWPLAAAALASAIMTLVVPVVTDSIGSGAAWIPPAARMVSAVLLLVIGRYVTRGLTALTLVLLGLWVAFLSFEVALIAALVVITGSLVGQAAVAALFAAATRSVSDGRAASSMSAVAAVKNTLAPVVALAAASPAGAISLASAWLLLVAVSRVRRARRPRA